MSSRRYALLPIEHSESKLLFVFVRGNRTILKGFFDFNREVFYIKYSPSGKLKAEAQAKLIKALSVYDYTLAPESVRDYFLSDNELYELWLKEHSLFNRY